MLEARHPVAARVEDLAVLVDAERASRGVGAVESLEHAVGAQRAGVAHTDDVLGYALLDTAASAATRAVATVRGGGAW